MDLKMYFHLLLLLLPEDHDEVLVIGDDAVERVINN